MPAAAPETVMAAQVATVLGKTVGTDVFRGPMRPVGSGVPDNAVFVLASGGPAPQPYLNGATGGDRKQPAVQVMVRGPSGDRATALSQARSIRAGCHKAALAGYQQCLAQQSEPLYVGQDEGDRHLFSVNFLLDVSE